MLHKIRDLLIGLPLPALIAAAALMIEYVLLNLRGLRETGTAMADPGRQPGLHPGQHFAHPDCCRQYR